MKDLLAQVKAHKAKERRLEPEVAKDVNPLEARDMRLVDAGAFQPCVMGAGE
jgi:hypothetical protein